MQKARLTLRRQREERREAVRQLVGRHWSEDGSQLAVPLNLLALYVRIMSAKLIAQNPRCLLSTFKRQHKPTVSAMQDWINDAIPKMCLGETLQRVGIDALFSVGVTKVALASPAQAAVSGWKVQAGMPFAERVDLDDLVFDVHARSFEEVGYIGHRFRAPIDVIKDSKFYGAARKELEPDDDSFFNAEGDERISMLGRGYYSDQEDYEDFVDLWEIYLPRHRVIVTLAHDYVKGADGKRAGDYGARALKEQTWLGPYCGPYHVLGLGVVPGNAMPKAPVQDLMDLHLAVNRIERKLINQAERQKEILAVQGGASEDGSRVVEASDGQAIKMDHPESAVVRNFGGPNQQNFGMLADMVNRFSWAAGNLDILGGLSPQSKTAKQDELLQQNSSAGVADLQQRMVTHTAAVMRSLCWYFHHDPVRVMQSTFSLPGMPELTLDREVTPQDRRQIPFEQLGVKVDPYSLQYQTPQARLAGMQQVVQTIVMPMSQLLQAQGISFDVNAYLKKVGEYMDMPDLADIITIREPPQTDPAGGGGEAGPGGPAETTRNYVRESMPGRTRQGNDMNMASSLMGANPGGSQESASPQMGE
jgi:hypothetical protein